MNKPFFSIVIPVYNREGKIKKCISSLKEQTFKDYEVIIVDDGSTDGSAEEICSLSNAEDRIILQKNEKNSSALVARYNGMKKCSGEFVLFLDCDDYYEVDTLESLHSELIKKPVDILRFGFKFEPGEEWYPPESEDPLSDMFKGVISPEVWKYCFHIDVIKKALEISETFYSNMGEDVYMSAVLLYCAKSFGKLDKALYHYVQGDGIASDHGHKTKEKLLRDMQYANEVSDHLLKFVGKKCGEKLEEAKKSVRTMLRFILFNSIFFANDIAEAVDYLNEINNEKNKELFEFGCNKILEAKALTDNGIEVDLRKMITDD